MAKEGAVVGVIEGGGSVEVAQKWRGTEADQYDMLVIGRPQQLRRNFQLVTILGFGCTLISTWEINITYVHHCEGNAQKWSVIIDAFYQDVWAIVDERRNRGAHLWVYCVYRWLWARVC